MKEYIAKAAKVVLGYLADATTLDNTLILENLAGQEESESESVASDLLNRALRGDFYSDAELDSKKLMAAALHIAKAKGLVSGLAGHDIASIADEGISRIKAEFQVGEGKIDVYEAADKMIDQAAARAATFLEKAAPMFISKGIDALANAVAVAYPNAAHVVLLVKEPVKLALSVAARKVIDKGLKTISTFAKSAVRKIGEKVKSYATNFITRYALS